MPQTVQVPPAGDYSVSPFSKGCLIVGLSSEELATLVVGPDGYVLTADPTSIYGVSWKVGGGGGGGGAAWGSITGTLSNQTDLQNALNAKQKYSNDAFIVVQTTSSPTTNGAALLAAYAAAKLLTPNGSALAANNRACVVVSPGTYRFPDNVGLVADAEFVDVVGLSANAENQVLQARAMSGFTAVVSRTALNVVLQNLTFERLDSSEDECTAYAENNAANLNSVLENIILIANDGDATATFSSYYSGTYSKVRNTGSGSPFGAYATGHFQDCVLTGGSVMAPVVAGRFINCVITSDEAGLANPSGSAVVVGCVVNGSIVNYTANVTQPITVYVKNVPVLTSGAPADIATINLPAGVTRWMVSATSDLANARMSGCAAWTESTSGTLELASIEIRTAAGGAGTLLGSIEGGLESTGAAAPFNWVSGSVIISGTSTQLFVRQTENSGDTGTVSFYLTIYPLP